MRINLDRKISWQFLLFIILVTHHAPFSQADVEYDQGWKKHSTRISILNPEENHYHDISYDHLDQEGIIFVVQDRSNRFGRNNIAEIYRFDSDSDELDSIPFSGTLRSDTDFVASFYRPLTRSIFVFESVIGFNNKGINEVKLQFVEGSEQYVLDSQPFSSLPESINFQVLGVAYNSVLDKFLLVASNGGIGYSFVYDFLNGQWTQVEGLSPSSANSRGDVEVGQNGTTAIFYNSVASSSDPFSVSMIFDFLSLTWTDQTDSTPPAKLINMDIMYNGALENYMLLGGTVSNTGYANPEILIIDPNNHEWTIIPGTSEFIIQYLLPECYYNSDSDLTVCLAIDKSRGDSVLPDYFSLFAFHIEAWLSGYAIDLGVPIPILLTAAGITVGFGIFVLLLIYRSRTKNTA